MKHSILVIAASLAFSSIMAQEVTKIRIGDNQNYGITYSLPAQVVHIHAEAQCTKIKAGIFAQYAEKYLGLKDVPMEDQTRWTVTGVTMSNEVVADSARTFHIDFNEKVLPPTFYLGPQGQLIAINKEPKKATSAAKGTVSASVSETSEETAAGGASSAIHAINVMNEELLKAGSKSKQAEIAARQIFRIRESRLNLLTGEVDALPADGASFQLVLNNLQAQEAAYMELFTGVETVETASRDFTIRPTGPATQVLFRFSVHFGFVDADDLSGEPYQYSVTVTEDKRKVPLQLDAKGKPKPKVNGIAYLVPGKAKVSVSTKGNVLCQEEWTMGQFGHVEHLLPTQFTNKKAPSSAWLDPVTGALQIFNTSL